MAFDPDQYLAGSSKKGQGFDPDAYLGGVQKPRKEDAAPRQDLSPVDQIGEITRKGARETGFVPVPGAKPAEPVGLGQSVLQSLYGIPVLAGGARLAQAATRGLPRVAPYTQRFAEAMIPRTGKELARATGAVATGTAAAYGAGELVPPTASPVIREAVQFGAGATGELPFAIGSQAAKAFRPLTERGVTKAAERVTRQFKPEEIETLPAFEASRGELVKRLRERLRGQPLDVEQLSAQELSELLQTDAGMITGRASELARRLGARVESRASRIGEPADATAIGDEARASLESRLDALKQRRRTNAQRLEGVAFGRALQREQAGDRVNNTDSAVRAVDEIDAMLKNPETKLPNITIRQLTDQLNTVRGILAGKQRTVDETGNIVEKDRPVSFQALENLRRFLKDRASGLPAEGFDAIGQQQAGRLTDLIEEIQKEFSPQFGRFLEQYKKDSEPINQFRKALGRSITGKEEFDFTEFKTDPAKLAGYIFASPTSVQNFIALSGNDVQLANKLARGYLSGLTEGKTGQQIASVLAKNKWLNLPAFADVKRDFTEQARLATKAVTRGEEVTTRAAEATRPLELGPDAAAGFRKLLTGPTRVQDIQAQAAVLSRTPEGQGAFKQAVRDVLATSAPGSLRQNYMQKIRPALEGSRLYTRQDLEFLDKEIIGIDEVNAAVNRAIQKASTMPGTESRERVLTRLVQDEVNQMRAGGVMASAIGALLASAASGVGLTATGLGAAAGGAAAATFLPRYREYNSNIRRAVSDIVSDPERLREVLAAPRDQQPSLIARMIRTGLYSAATATNEPQER